MSEHERPEGVSETLWARVIGAGAESEFVSERDQLVSNGFACEDAARIAAARVPSISAMCEDTNAAATSSNASPSSPAAERPLNIDPTRIAEEVWPDDFADKRPVSMTTNIRWVLDNISCVEVTKDTCPSAAAWTMLHQCKHDKAFKRKFFETYVPKLMPSGAAMEEQARHHDDGRDLKGKMAQLLAEFRAGNDMGDHVGGIQ